MISFEISIRLINSFFTIGIGILLLSVYIRKIRFTSLFMWAIAFIIYGLEIFIRTEFPWNYAGILILGTGMFALLILGTSNLISPLANLAYGIYIFIILAAVTPLFPSESWYQYGIFALYGGMTVAAIHLRLVLGRFANRFLLGWFLLFIVNIFFVVIIEIEWLADLLVMPAKALLAMGMMDQRLANMVLGIRKIYKSMSIGR